MHAVFVTSSAVRELHCDYSRSGVSWARKRKKITPGKGLWTRRDESRRGCYGLYTLQTELEVWVWCVEKKPESLAYKTVKCDNYSSLAACKQKVPQREKLSLASGQGAKLDAWGQKNKSEMPVMLNQGHGLSWKDCRLCHTSRVCHFWLRNGASRWLQWQIEHFHKMSRWSNWPTGRQGTFLFAEI